MSNENETVRAGRQYIVDFLPADADAACDTSWVAEGIDDGRLVACPRCHFLHLPARAFPPDPVDVAHYGPPVDACDVCAELPASCDPICWGQGWERGLAGAGDALADERMKRAATLYDLWIGATHAADALRVAAIADGLDGLRARAAG